MLLAEAVHDVLFSLSLHCIFLGSPPAPIQTTCLSLVTITPKLFVGALASVVTELAEEGLHSNTLPSLAEHISKFCPKLSKENDLVSKASPD